MRAICARIAELEQETQSLSAVSERVIDLLQERRTALISAAVTGQIDVRKSVAPAPAKRLSFIKA